jgi:hypothetical protein
VSTQDPSEPRERTFAIGPGLGAMMLILLASCPVDQQQQAAETVREAQAQLQPIAQRCEQQMLADRDRDPIRTKVELVRSVFAGAPPPAMLADQSRATPAERLAISKWQSIREACVQEEMRYGLSLPLPPNLQSARDKLVLNGREMSERMGLLIAALYDVRLTYGQFAAERLKVADQTIASLTRGTPSAAEQPDIAASSPTGPTGADEIPLSRKGATYLVPVAVNRLPPIPFVLDSGADFVALPAEVVFTLLRTGTLQSSDFIVSDPSRKARGRQTMRKIVFVSVTALALTPVAAHAQGTIQSSPYGIQIVQTVSKILLIAFRIRHTAFKTHLTPSGGNGIYGNDLTQPIPRAFPRTRMISPKHALSGILGHSLCGCRSDRRCLSHRPV